MSKELTFTDDNTVKYLDTSSSFDLAITQDGTAFDLTNATAIDVKVANASGYVFDKSIDMTTVTEPLAGVITMPVDAEVMNALTPDDYTIEVWVTLSSLVTAGSQEGLTDDGTTSSTTSSTTSYTAIFPSDDTVGFTINGNLTDVDGETVDTISLATFEGELHSKVSATDTANWQKSKITADTGAAVTYLYTANSDNLNTYLNGLPIGLTTFYVQSGVTNNPSSASSRGLFHKECAGYGVGYLINVNGNQWSIILNGSSTPIYTKLSTSTDLSTGLATKEDKLSYTPADDSKVAHLSGANNFDTIPTVNNNTVVTSDTVVGTRNYIATNSWIALGQYGYYTAVNGSLIKSNGTNDVHSDYISIASQTMTFTWYSLPTGGGATVHSYDSTKKWIKSFQISNAVGSTKIDLPSNTVFITVNVPNPNTRGGQSKITVGDVKTDWTPAPEDKADDSKVAHLSGTNNFDTVPTVNNTALSTSTDLSTGLATKEDKLSYTPADDSKVVHLSTGTTTDRPTGQVTGYQYFDTTLNKPIWYTGTAWVDATGTAV